MTLKTKAEILTEDLVAQCIKLSEDQDCISGPINAPDFVRYVLGDDMAASPAVSVIWRRTRTSHRQNIATDVGTVDVRIGGYTYMTLWLRDETPEKWIPAMVTSYHTAMKAAQKIEKKTGSPITTVMIRKNLIYPKVFTRIIQEFVRVFGDTFRGIAVSYPSVSVMFSHDINIIPAYQEQTERCIHELFQVLGISDQNSKNFVLGGCRSWHRDVFGDSKPRQVSIFKLECTLNHLYRILQDVPTLGLPVEDWKSINLSEIK